MFECKISERLTELRTAKGVTQEEVAASLSVSNKPVSKWENELSVPDSDMLISISQVLETPLSTLLRQTIVEPKADDLKAIAEKLEVINLQLAQRKGSRRKTLHWLLITLCVATSTILAVLIMLNSPYLRWDYSDPETAVFGAAFHAFEYLFVRLAPIIVAGTIAGIILARKKV